MSDIVPTSGIKLSESEWFKKNNRKTIMDLFLSGLGCNDIAKSLNLEMTDDIKFAREIRRIEDTINHPHFLNRLNRKMQIKQNELTVKKIIIQNNLIDLYRDIINGEANPADIPVDKVIVEMTKLLKMSDKIAIGKVINTNINNFNKAPTTVKTNEEDEKNLLKEFGVVEEAEVEEDYGEDE